MLYSQARVLLAALTLAVMMMPPSAPAGEAELTGAWNGAGKHWDWTSSLVAIPNLDIKVAVSNDSQFIFMVTTSANPRMQARILGAGLTYWFDALGGAKKSLGIQSPVCGRNPDLIKEMQKKGTLDELSLMKEAAMSSMTCELMREGKDAGTMYAAQMDSIGIRSTLSFRDSQLIQEIRIRIPHSVLGVLGPGRQVSVCIEPCEIDRGGPRRLAGVENNQGMQGGHGRGMGALRGGRDSGHPGEKHGGQSMEDETGPSSVQWFSIPLAAPSVK